MSSHPIAVVTGGAGFIGSHMVDLLLEQGFAVRAVDNLLGGRMENLAHLAANPDFLLERRDIRSFAPDDPLFRGARYVFHFAGIGDIVIAYETVAREAARLASWPCGRTALIQARSAPAWKCRPCPRSTTTRTLSLFSIRPSPSSTAAIRSPS